MITMDDNILAVWVVEIRGPSDGNWLASLSKKNNGFELIYRFRWYVDNEAHDSKDPRNWFVIQFGTSRTNGEAIQHGREIYDMTLRSLRKYSMVPHSWELVRGERTVDEFCDALAMMPGMHSRKVSEREAQDWGLGPRH